MSHPGNLWTHATKVSSPINPRGNMVLSEARRESEMQKDTCEAFSLEIVVIYSGPSSSRVKQVIDTASLFC